MKACLAAGKGLVYATDPTNALREVKRVAKSGAPVAAVTWEHLSSATCEPCSKPSEACYRRRLREPVAPSPLSARGALETLFESGGLAAERSIDVPTAYTYPDIDTAIRAQMSSGPARRAIEHAGAQPLRDALTAALIDHHGSDKSIRLDNVFRVLIARA